MYAFLLSSDDNRIKVTTVRYSPQVLQVTRNFPNFRGKWITPKGIAISFSQLLLIPS